LASGTDRAQWKGLDSMIDLDVMDRRALMARMALLLGASAVPETAFAAAKRLPRKRFLAPAQFQLLSALADTLVPTTDTPGAVAAGIPSKLDGMLISWASAETKAKVTSGLSRLNAAAIAQKKKGFALLSPAERKAFLTGYDVAALKKATPPPGAPKVNFFTPVAYVADPAYLRIKELVINLYYASEIAMTRELVYEHVPGTWQPSTKTTDKTRPWASVGPF
jgi:gluconate 2-dehydrogenase gamma chain